MSASLLPFPQQESEQTLWDRYVALVEEMADNPSLSSDMQHAIERHRAHQRFLEVFGRSDAKAG